MQDKQIRSSSLNTKNEAHLSLAHGVPTVIILLNLSDAFDTIDHGTLLDCLTSWFAVCSRAYTCVPLI